MGYEMKNLMKTKFSGNSNLVDNVDGYGGVVDIFVENDI